MKGGRSRTKNNNGKEIIALKRNEVLCKHGLGENQSQGYVKKEN